MKKYIILGIASFAALLLAGCGTQTAQTTNPTGNTTDNKKVALSAEGGICTADANCETGLKCITSKCVSGKVGSVCATYKDCDTGLYCVKSVCSNPPTYSKYFSNIVIAKMKPGPPGSNNMPVPTTEFNATTDNIAISVEPKPGADGDVYCELVNSITGETAASTADHKVTIDSKKGGQYSFGLSPQGKVGDFNLNIYFNNELIYTTIVKISQ